MNLDELTFDERGLIPVIAQDAENGDVLMLAWANREALERTVEEGRMVYWSRSRQELWRKGDTSGHIQLVRGVRLDCDGDTVLVAVQQVGAACHTGDRTCFDADDLDPVIASGGAGAPEHFPPAVRAGADAVLAASVFHSGLLTIDDVKRALAADGVPVRGTEKAQ